MAVDLHEKARCGKWLWRVLWGTFAKLAPSITCNYCGIGAYVWDSVDRRINWRGTFYEANYFHFRGANALERLSD